MIVQSHPKTSLCTRYWALLLYFLENAPSARRQGRPSIIFGRLAVSRQTLSQRPLRLLKPVRLLTLAFVALRSYGMADFCSDRAYLRVSSFVGSRRQHTVTLPPSFRRSHKGAWPHAHGESLLTEYVSLCNCSDSTTSPSRVKW